MRRRLLAMLIIFLFVSSIFTIGNEAGKGKIKNEKVVASITYKSSEYPIATLQPIVVITQPEDGAVVTDPHLVVLGYATDENGMNYWEWEWRWQGGSYSNSSYFETAEYVEFRIDIYGLHPGWNLVIVRFKNIYGAIGEDSVNVTYNPPDTEPPQVTIEEPEDGAVLSNPDIMLRGVARDNVGITQFGYTHEWEGGATGSSWPLEEPTTEYPFEIPITLHEGWNKIRVEASDNASNVGYDEINVTYVTEDTVPPTTTKIVGDPQYDEGFYVASKTPFTLIAEDNEGGSGVKAIYYRIWNNGTWTDWMEYTQPFTLPGEYFHYLEYYAVDNAGNEEEVHNQTHSVDNYAPVTTISISEPSYIENTTELGEHWIVSPDTVFDVKGVDDCCKIKRIVLYNPVTQKKDKNEDKVRIKLYRWSDKKGEFVLVMTKTLMPGGEPLIKSFKGTKKIKIKATFEVTTPDGKKKEVIKEEMLPCKDLMDKGDSHKYLNETEDNEKIYTFSVEDSQPIHVNGTRVIFSEFKVKLCPKPKKGVRKCFSGIKSTNCRIWHNGKWDDWTKIEGPFNLPEEGIYYLEFYSKDNIGNTEGTTNITIVVKADIHSPEKPNRPEGPTSGKIWKNYTYTTSTTDLDGDHIYYLFDWGDENFSGWLGPYASGETCEAFYSWRKEGNYQIRVKAIDEYGMESEWSDPLPITMPKNRPIYNHLIVHFLEKLLERFSFLRQYLHLSRIFH